MIVRNEAHVLRRCLASVGPIADHWVIVDTGSTDRTRDVVRDCMRALPGSLVERPWVDFGHNRTEAFEYARQYADYVLVIDADETLEVAENFHKSSLTRDAYKVEVRYGSTAYVRTQLLRSSLPWRYVGKVHEYAWCETARAEEVVAGLRINVRHDGARSRDPHTYRRDALLLESALLEDPDNPRTVFYLAQSYRDSGDLDLAIRYYRQRAGMGGWADEVWFSLYQIARLRERLDHAWGEVLEDYLAASEFQPDRAEPLYSIGQHYTAAGAFHLAHMFLAQAMSVRCPGIDRLFINRAVYDYLLPLDYAAACGAVGRRADAVAICNRLLRSGVLPPDRIDQAIVCRRANLTAPAAATSPNDQSTRTTLRLRVCVPFADPGSSLDECLESLVQQRSASLDFTLVDDGLQPTNGDRLPLDDVRFRLQRNTLPRGFEACVDRFVADQCAPDDIVIPLLPVSRLAGETDVARALQTAFADPACQVLYGQHRLASGALGSAEPAADQADILRRGAGLATQSPLIFRASWWREHASPHLEAPWDALVRAAGPHGTRFTDTVLTALSDEGARVPPIDPARLEPANTLPSISCLMVTHDRLALAKRAIRCFERQTYSNRELVIVTDGHARYRAALERFVAELGLENVRMVRVDVQGREKSLGELRNVSLAAADGDLVCQWDDDDCYHPDRIRLQVEHMLADHGRACFLTDHLHYLEDDAALVWIDWTLGGKSGRDQLLPGTMVMYRDPRFRYPESGPYARRGEDSMLLSDLYDNVPVVAARSMGHLYLYTYHGRNTFDRQHHYEMSAFSFSVADLEEKRDVIRAAMRHYPVAKPFVVIGRDGPAFTLND
jgi:glycosyltransferase involved in cell wall biosynthesis